MHNGQWRGAVKGARLNLIIKFYDYSGREHAALTACARRQRVAAQKKRIRISRDEVLRTQ